MPYTVSIGDAMTTAAPHLATGQSSQAAIDTALMMEILSASNDCIKVIDLDGNLSFMSVGGMRVMEVDDFEIIRGCPWPDFWKDEGNDAAKEALACARAGKSQAFIGAADTAKGDPRWWEVNVSPIFGKDGKPERILSISRDITGTRKAQEAALRSERRMKDTLKAGSIGYWELDLKTMVLEASDVCRQNFGRDENADFTYDELLSVIHPDDLSRMQAAVGETLATGTDYDIQYRIVHSDNSVSWVLIRGQLVNDDKGQPVVMSGMSLDITDRMRAEETQQMLTHELAHRVKNTLAVVQAIAMQSLRNASSLKDAGETLQSRLMALSKAHDVLMQDDWRGAPIREVVEQTIRNMGMHESGRVQVRGDKVVLGPQAALSFGLVLHELMTNAVKYGALSNENGRIEIGWSAVHEDGQRLLQFSWSEINGPTVVAPERKGFGSRLIASSLGALGTVDVAYLPTGLVLRLSAKMAQVEAALSPVASETEARHKDHGLM